MPPSDLRAGFSLPASGSSARIAGRIFSFQGAPLAPKSISPCGLVGVCPLAVSPQVSRPRGRRRFEIINCGPIRPVRLGPRASCCVVWHSAGRFVFNLYRIRLPFSQSAATHLRKSWYRESRSRSQQTRNSVPRTPLTKYMPRQPIREMRSVTCGTGFWGENERHLAFPQSYPIGLAKRRRNCRCGGISFYSAPPIVRSHLAHARPHR